MGKFDTFTLIGDKKQEVCIEVTNYDKHFSFISISWTSNDRVFNLFFNAEFSNELRFDKAKQNMQGLLKKPESLRKSKHRKGEIGSQPLQSKIGRRLAQVTSFRYSSSVDKADAAKTSVRIDQLVYESLLTWSLLVIYFIIMCIFV